jgi:hypothetical protein
MNSDSAFGDISYPELLQFLSMATFGSYLPDCQCALADNIPPIGELNRFHRAFLCWNFFRPIGDSIHLRRSITSMNSFFGSNINIDTIRRRYLAPIIYETTLNNVLYVRLREGYTVKQIRFSKHSDNQQQRIYVELCLAWKPGVNIEYHAIANWPQQTTQVK